jgi:hypothetical protein
VLLRTQADHSGSGYIDNWRHHKTALLVRELIQSSRPTYPRCCRLLPRRQFGYSQAGREVHSGQTGKRAGASIGYRSGREPVESA